MSTLEEILNIKYPIIQGGMGNISNATLASSISNAGGLGTIGVGTLTPQEIEIMIIETKEKTSNSFCVNIPLSVNPYVKEMINLVIQYKVPIVSLSAGNPAPFISLFKDNGIKIISVVASVKQAIKVEKLGVDVVVAEGYEAAGINSALETTTLTLIPQIVKEVNIPVVAAGGIGDGKGLAAMLALGASGVQMGTRFIATKEAPFHPNYKEAIIKAQDGNTVIVGRTFGKIRRLIDTPYAQSLLELEKKGTAELFQEKTSEHYHKVGAIEGKLTDGFINGGQIAGLIDDVPTVEELLKKMVNEAKKQLQQVFVKLNTYEDSE
ncbi:NAD(P)H-dependent flavin oxidoreductase [Bacillus suaedaesalsae]|uniref:Probable nitronate monooxygenase n=1 Tax=Bacillus suaedaesalsae TaxID=2810349 RepID=A0ABS2DLQ5_9BACI|nr:nitronate monooxygenase [Bacillus suaedaesalsae]MBM6619416.1 nitronate monooxygenase [Bacillus suaedaesalsae]